MLRKILIANRGEIALRIIKATRQLNIENVIVYSSIDRDSMAVKLADNAICIGAPAAKNSYLNQESIIQTAKSLNCDAIHPGYGFLSENAEFAKKCEENDIVFVGPSSEIIKKMGNKQVARTLMRLNGIPVVPGSDDVLKSVSEAKEIANTIGFPVLIKASAGGGGRGMRIANSMDELEGAFNEATNEALSAFGNGDVYIEKLITNPKHIEVQILGDNYGNIIHLGERDCSIQRRNQKMIEEAPADALMPEIRAGIISAALKAANVVEYTSAGTVEFIVDSLNNYYFIEMNTRVQVEHPVTEMVAGIDIVRSQVLIASGEKLDIKQKDITINGNAIECRINAEDVNDGFKPAPGIVRSIQYPTGCGVRVESALQEGDIISPWYDSMLCKIIVNAPSREEAIRKMRFALKEFKIEGIKTNIEFILKVLEDKMFISGNTTTALIERIIKDI